MGLGKILGVGPHLTEAETKNLTHSVHIELGVGHINAVADDRVFGTHLDISSSGFHGWGSFFELYTWSMKSHRTLVILLSLLPRGKRPLSDTRWRWWSCDSKLHVRIQ